MSRLSRVATATYERVLRLYPQRFSGVFADEMLETFAARLADTSGPMARLGVVVREAASFPFNLAQEHWRERRTAVHAVIGGSVMTMLETPRPFRRTTQIWLAIMAVYAGMVVAPFFLFGIHTHSPQDIYEGRLDPKSECVPAEGRMPHPQCVSLYGDSPVLVATYAVMWLAPAWGIGMTLFTGWRLARRWRYLNRAQRMAGSTLALAGLSLAAFAMSPLGSLIYVWLMD